MATITGECKDDACKGMCEKAVLSREVTKAGRMKIMKILATAKAKSDVSKLMDKK